MMRVQAALRVLLLVGYFVATVVYITYRVRQTLDVHWLWYGSLFLVLEVLWATSVFLYALVVTKGVDGAAQPAQVKRIRAVRVLIPCHDEPLELVETTVQAALAAKMPPGIAKHVYLLDDKPDARKQDWVHSMTAVQQGVLHYQTRTRGTNERNLKSCNLNAALTRLYGPASAGDGDSGGNHSPSVPTVDASTELVAVFNPDQVCKRNFFMRTLSLMGQASMLVTPQCFNNVDPNQDIFNHTRTQWYEYIYPGISAWGSVSCTGTNYIVKAGALKSVGYFDEDILAEGVALSMDFKVRGYKSMYLPEYLATGMAPDTPSAILKERTKWAKGHMQIVFGKRNPLLTARLPFKSRIFYGMEHWAIILTSILTPVFFLVPVNIVWFGVFPFDISRSFTYVLLGYYSVLFLTVYSSVNVSYGFHFLDACNQSFQFWLEWVSNGIYWYTYLKAIVCVVAYNTIGKHIPCLPVENQTMDDTWSKGSQSSSSQSRSKSKIGKDQQKIDPVQSKSFSSLRLLSRAQSMLKGGEKSRMPVFGKAEWAVNDVEAHVLFVVLFVSVISALAGFGWSLSGRLTGWRVVQLVSSFWCLLNAIPPFLFFFSVYLKGKHLKKAAIGSGILFLMVLLISIVVLICFAYDEHNFKEVIEKSFLFFDAQKSGILPEEVKHRIPWRDDSGLLDRTMNNDSLVGGYYDAGDTIKFGLPLAVTLSFLAWGAIEFPNGYHSLPRVHDTLMWGTNYMLKCHTGDYEFYAQVGTGELEHETWKRPEKLLKGKHRVGQMVNATHPGSDVVGASAAAMAITSMVIAKEHPSYSGELLKHAKQLYEFGIGPKRGKYSDVIADAHKFYPSTDYYDDLAWAAIWLYEATGRKETRYLIEAQDHVDSLLQPLQNKKNPSQSFNWDSVGQGACLMLYIETKEDRFLKCIQRHIDLWLHEIPRTPKGLVWLRQSGALRESANTALLFLILAKHQRKNGAPIRNYGVYECWAYEQIRYMLGDGGRSFVVGYGRNPPVRIHHRGANCPVHKKCGWNNMVSDSPNANIIQGGLVGGPDKNDVYLDDRQLVTQSEVAIDMNAGYTSALAGLQEVRQTRGFGMCLQGKGIIKWFRPINS